MSGSISGSMSMDGGAYSRALALDPREIGVDTGFVERASFARTLEGRWRQALRAERALGWVLWGALAAVIVAVSGG